MQSHKQKINEQGTENIILLGNPNVGKSVIFGLLTGKYVIVSNYTGTTVEITHGLSAQNKALNIVDTPGINSLLPKSEDERVTRDILLKEPVRNIIQVADAKNLRRSLYISLQLAETGFPYVLDLNMEDEARSRGISIDRKRLSALLGVDVISTVATQRKGIKELGRTLNQGKKGIFSFRYSKEIEAALNMLLPLLPETSFAPRFLGLMLLAEDAALEDYLRLKVDQESWDAIHRICRELASGFNHPLNSVLSQQRMQQVDQILAQVMGQEQKGRNPFAQVLGNLAMHPLWGIPLVLLVMFITYQFVGVLGAGICVDFLESVFFGKWINPLLIRLFGLIPVPWIQELFVGEYGVLTMALTYAVAIVLPIVAFFFFIFGILEDSGYLPRLAIMVNRVFKVMGLNGKAVLPMILGLGCDTMATMTARILPGKKERIIVTLLLALAIPCSAQLGVIFGATAAISGLATIIWLFTIIGIIFLVGFLSSKVIPGQKSDFILEIPPMRLPKISNILVKTFARVQWYLKEAVPLFMLGTLVLFGLNKSGLLAGLEELAAPVVVNLLDLPKEAATAFVMGFLRRDYAAVLLAKSGQLDNIQMLVAIVTITLFVPCIANLFIMIKERGWKVASLITLFILVFAFAFGGLFNFVLRLLEVSL